MCLTEYGMKLRKHIVTLHTDDRARMTATAAANSAYRTMTWQLVVSSLSVLFARSRRRSGTKWAKISVTEAKQASANWKHRNSRAYAPHNTHQSAVPFKIRLVWRQSYAWVQYKQIYSVSSSMFRLFLLSGLLFVSHNQLVVCVWLSLARNAVYLLTRV